jgi:hypothetical protein
LSVEIFIKHGPVHDVRIIWDDARVHVVEAGDCPVQHRAVPGGRT